MAFPQLGNIDERIYKTITNKAGDNLRATQTMPWIRVVSCLGKFLAIESSKESESFAQKYGGTKKSGRLGLEYPSPDKPNDIYAYGHNDRGLRPSPSIDSIAISQGNEGLSKKAAFTIVCYSMGQCEKIMEYFLEPGKMVLVEWGENQSKSVRQKAVVEKCSIALYNNLKHVQEKRRSSGGTYDAVLGVITGGSMSYGSNETYEVQVELTSIGEIPAYLQHHKGGAPLGSELPGSKIFGEGELADNDKTIGTRLFMQMYNELPAVKRTKEIKQLILAGSKHHQPWVADSINFINMDKETREHLVDQMKGGGTFQTVDGQPAVEIKSDVPLFTEKRYIRAALAFTILDSTSNMKMIPENSLGCKGITVNSDTVQWKNTICRGFKNMFTADSDYLYIPNKYAPNFDLRGALSTTLPISNILPVLTKSVALPVIGSNPPTYVRHLLLKDPDDKKRDLVDDLHPKVYPPFADRNTSYFPNNYPLNWKDQGCYDTSYEPITAKAGDWGFLRDLYINFDFFCDTIQKSGLVTKDVYYDLLNGMSSATNMYWNFQIVPRGFAPIYSPEEDPTDGFYLWKRDHDIPPDSCGQTNIEIVDLSMGGILSKNTGVGLAKFQSRGSNSPFLSADLTFDIPGAMKSQVIAKGLANKPDNSTVEAHAPVLHGLFSNKPDTVKEVLSDVQKQVDESDKIQKGIDDKKAEDEKWWITKKIEWANEKWEGTPEMKAADEQSKSNYEFFVKSAMVIPWLQDREDKRDISNNWTRSGKNSSMRQVAKVGGWDDPSILKKIQLLNEGTIVLNSPGNQGQSNVPILPIKFNFTIHGISGIRVGDTFSITDLPTKYRDRVFQVTQVSQEIQQNIWTTGIEGSMRNMQVGEGKPDKYVTPTEPKKDTKKDK